MLIIRLQRTGSRNNPDFRIVLAEKHRAADKKVIEVFGEYNPRTKFFHLRDETNLKEWLARNVELSPTLHNLLVEKKILSAAKVKAWRPKVKEGGEPAKAASPKPEQSEDTSIPAEASETAPNTPAA